MDSIDLFINVIERELRAHPEWSYLNQRNFLYKLFRKKFPQKSKENLAKVYSNWKSRRSRNISQVYKNAISDIIGFDTNVWKMSNQSEQKKAIQTAVKMFLSPKLTTSIELSHQQNSSSLTEKQYKVLREIKKLPLTEIPDYIYLQNEFFQKTSDAQQFLLETLNYFFENGLYELLDRHVFPNLTPENSSRTDVKKIRAYTLGSLNTPRYLDAKVILESITDDTSAKEIADLSTSIVSNTRRDLFSQKNLDDTTCISYLKLLYDDYLHIFEKEMHYYQGINLAYMIALLELFDESSNLSIKEIHKESQRSIELDINSGNTLNQYYASISEIEFNLLQPKDQTQAVKTLLKNLSPQKDPVLRTHRQITQFIEFSNRFNKGVSLNIFENMANILQQYLNQPYKKHLKGASKILR